MYKLYRLEYRTAKNWFEIEPTSEIRLPCKENVDTFIKCQEKRYSDMGYLTIDDAWGFDGGCSPTLDMFITKIIEDNDVDSTDIIWFNAYAGIANMTHEIHLFAVEVEDDSESE